MWTAEILRDRTTKLCVAKNMLYSLRKRKYNPKLIQGSSAACPPKGGATAFLYKPRVLGCKVLAKPGDARPQGPRKEEYQPKKMLLKP